MRNAAKASTTVFVNTAMMVLTVITKYGEYTGTVAVFSINDIRAIAVFTDSTIRAVYTT